MVSLANKAIQAHPIKKVVIVKIPKRINRYDLQYLSNIANHTLDNLIMEQNNPKIVCAEHSTKNFSDFDIYGYHQDGIHWRGQYGVAALTSSFENILKENYLI